MSLSNARGVYVIAPTPFLDDGRIDNDSVDRMTDFYLAAGVTGITVLGQMGEAPKLEQREALEVAERVIRRSTVPVIVGVSAPGFAAMRSLARASMEAGAAGVMIAPPNTLRTDEQIAGYFRQASEAIGARRPLRAAGLSADLQRGDDAGRDPPDRASRTPSCVMLKHEDWPGLEKISALRGVRARRRHAPHLDPLRQRRAVPRLRARARRGWRDDRLLLSRHAGRGRAAARRRPARCDARPVRRAPAADPLRAAAGRRPGRAQVRADAARRHRVRGAAQAGRAVVGGRARRGGLPARARRARRSRAPRCG